MKLLQKLKLALRRPLYALTAMALIVGVATPTVLAAGTADGNQLQVRSIEMTTAQPSATGVTYTVTFTPQTTTATVNVIIEFCDDTPLIGASCSFDVTANNRTVPDFSSVGSGTAGVTVAQYGTSTHTVLISNGTTGLTKDTPYTVDMTNVTNPDVDTDPDTNNAGTFYARIYTYPDATSATGSAQYTNATNPGDTPDPGTYDDYGGIAMSTSQTIQVTARVMESLTFCTSAQDISGGNYGGQVADNSCAQASTPNIDIGTGTPKSIDSNGVYVGNAYMQMSTNATSGAVVRMKSTNTCANGGLSTGDGSTCTEIPGIGDSGAAGTPPNSTVLMNAGTPNFGLYVADSVLTVGPPSGTSTGTIVPDQTYNDGNAAHTGADDYFAMPGTEVTGTYGSAIASCTGPINAVNSKLVFGATAALTTPAGIYTTGESLIATGTF